MELSSLLNNTAPLAVEYFGATINCQVFTDRLTPTKIGELAAALADEGEEQKDEIALMLSEFLHSWDITVDGEPLEPTYDNLMGVSFPLLAHTLRQVESFLGERARQQKS